jgi:hypothetical protein
MKTSTQVKFDKIIKEGFIDILKPLGYKKKANNFYESLDGLGHLINIQKSRWSTQIHISFTLNIGVFLPEYWLAFLNYQGVGLPSFPTEPECIVRQRIGDLRGQHDIWYDLYEATDENQLVAEMQENLHDFILPYFNKMKTIEGFLNCIETENLSLQSLGKLILYGELKHLNKAREEYDLLMQEKSMNPHFRQRIKEFGVKYGVS